MEPSRPQGRLTDHIALDVLSSRFGRDLLEELLSRSGRREKRIRRLPAHVMMRYVIAMGLYFDESYDEVMRRLVGNLYKLGSWDDGWHLAVAGRAYDRHGEEGAGAGAYGLGVVGVGCMPGGDHAGRAEGVGGADQRADDAGAGRPVEDRERQAGADRDAVEVVGGLPDDGERLRSGRPA